MQLNMHRSGAQYQTSKDSQRQMNEALRGHTLDWKSEKEFCDATTRLLHRVENGSAGVFGLRIDEKKLHKIGLAATGRHKRKSSGPDAKRSSKPRPSSMSVAPGSQVDSDSDQDAPLITKLIPTWSSEKESGIKKESLMANKANKRQQVLRMVHSESKPHKALIHSTKVVVL